MKEGKEMLKAKINVWKIEYGTFKFDSVDEVVKEYRMMHNYNDKLQFDGIEYREQELFINNGTNDKDDETIKIELIEQIKKIDEELN